MAFRAALGRVVGAATRAVRATAPAAAAAAWQMARQLPATVPAARAASPLARGVSTGSSPARLAAPTPRLALVPMVYGAAGVPVAQAMVLRTRRFASSHTTPPTDGASCGSAVTSSPASTVLVKIGSGEDTSWVVPWDGLARMDRGGVLRALKADSSGFGPKFKDHSLDDFMVMVATADTDEATGVTWTPLLRSQAVASALGTTVLRYVFVKVEPRALSKPTSSGGPVELTEFIKVGKNKVPTPAKVVNEADFDRLISAGNTVRHINSSNRQPISIILRWEDAVAASGKKGTMLQLISTAAAVEDIGNLKGAIGNRARGIESQTTHAIAHDPELLLKFAPLRVLNNGRGVKFYHKKTKALVLEVDGIVVNTELVLINECKSSLDPLHITGTTDKEPDDEDYEMGLLERVTVMENILAEPNEYRCNAPGVLEACVGKKVRAVASGFDVSLEAQLHCHNQGIELLRPQGPGGTYMVAAPAQL